MTEEEAKKKWCPMAPPNMANTNDLCRCLGSGCAAWRWIPLAMDDAFRAAMVKAAVEIGDKTDSKHRAAKHVSENRAAYGLPTQPFDGYCGLAGKP